MFDIFEAPFLQLKFFFGLARLEIEKRNMSRQNTGLAEKTRPSAPNLSETKKLDLELH